MPDSEESGAPVKTKAVLVDPASTDVIWMNEAAAAGIGEEAVAGPSHGLQANDVVPVAEQMGVPAALSEVAETGIAQHLHANLVSTAQGGLLIVTSVYRLPDGKLLVLTDNAWENRSPKRDGLPQGSGRRRR